MTSVEARAPIALQNILLATDFSSASDRALEYALGIARRYDSRVYLSHVIRPDAYQLVPPEAMTAAVENAQRYAEQEIANLLISGRLRDVPHQVLLARGSVWPVLSEWIREHGVDLVVVGTHGRTGIRKLLLGSAAEEIFRLATVPVLTVGPRVSERPPREAHLKQILLAVDLTPISERAAAYAISLAQEHQARLTLLHVVRDAAESTPHNEALLKEYFIRRLQAMIPEEAELWCEAEFAVEFGDAADSILRLAGDRQADLIVLGVRRTAEFAGHLPPATAYKVVCQAHCPVLTVRR
jgi:nucleotide-binding universal stress UspA family protein